MNDLISFEAYRKLAWKLARAIFERFKGVNRTHTLDDIFQEVSVAFVKCASIYRPEQGAFSTYFYKAAWNEVRRQINVGKRGQPDAISLDSDQHREEEGLHEKLCDHEAPLPDDILNAKQKRELALSQMSQKTRLVVELAEHPPRWLLDSVDHIKARNDWGKQLGVLQRSNAPEVGLGFVMSILGYTQTSREGVIAELARIRNKNRGL